MTGAQHALLNGHLYPGDGMEAAALILCGQLDGDDRHVLTANKIEIIPHDQCKRTSVGDATPDGDCKDSQPSRRLPGGGIDKITIAVHYLQPGRSSLRSRGVYCSEDVRVEPLKRDDPVECRRQQGEGYIRGVREDRPAVISLNTLIAGLAVNEMLARIHQYRYEANDKYALQQFALHEATNFLTAESAFPVCNILAKEVGRGDVTPLLNRPELSEGAAV